MNATSVQRKSSRRPSPLYLIHGAWHTPLLVLYMAVVLIHMSEHMLQMYQFAVLGWPRPASGGLLGLWVPQLAMAELLHFTYNLFQWMGLLVLRGGFRGRARTFWMLAFAFQCWHLFEHTLMQLQWLTGLYLYNATKTMNVLEIWVPRIELHFTYNMLVVIPTVIAVVLYVRQRRVAR